MNTINTTNKKSLLYKFTLLLIFLNIWFPKAGFKISGIPITISNLVFFFVFILWVITKLKNKTKISKKITIAISLSIIYFFAKYFLIFYRSNSLVEYVTYIIPLIIYPLSFFIIFDQIDTKEKINDVTKIIYYGFIMICIYSLIQFLFGIEKTAIPGLTVNLTDYNTMGSTWFMQKSNGTDMANSKIVSTYQNGNLLGINLLLLYPMIYMLLKKDNKNKQLIISFLTLSRTCWLGIVLFLFFGIMLENDKTKKSFKRKVIILLFCFLSILFVFNYMPSVSNRLFNTHSSDWLKMSGRTEGLNNVIRTVHDSNSVLAYFIGPEGIVSYSGLAYEMFPLAVFAQSGIIGLLLIYSVFIIALKKIKKNNPISKGIKLALIIWLIIGCIECGYWLPPTAMNIFILIALGCSANLLYEGEL